MAYSPVASIPNILLNTKKSNWHKFHNENNSQGSSCVPCWDGNPGVWCTPQISTMNSSLKPVSQFPLHAEWEVTFGLVAHCTNAGSIRIDKATYNYFWGPLGSKSGTQEICILDFVLGRGLVPE
jgi:hypothetical protein